jgi:type IV pilus assembly protein PilV
MRADAMHKLPYSLSRQRGTSLVEVLVTVIVLAFGLLGIAALQAKAQVGNLESYQRAQAVVLLQDMRARTSSNGANAASYVTSTPLGTNTSDDDCSGAADTAAKDKCEWGNELKGAAEVDTASTNKVGAMIGARGCIEVLQAPNPAAGVCQPGIYRLTVAWQGMHPTKVSSLACGQNAYGSDDSFRRAIAVQVAVGLPNCS